MIDKKIFLLFLICLIGFTSAQTQIGNTNDDFYGGKRGTASYTNYGSSFNSYYGSDLSTYWPSLSNRDSCEARQDILVQISPIGCQPAVVTSALLAEQNVPVFCQLDLLQLNPAIDVKQIRSLKFNGKYPEYVAGVGYHPARAGLRTQDRLLGSPIESNIGYVVVILKKNPQEKDLPNFFNFTLSATVDYYSGNGVGIGATELILQETNNNDWQTLKDRQSFLKGQYSVRLLESDANQASVALYHEDVKTSEITLQRGQQQPNAVYLPNSYCQTGLQFSYDDFISPSNIVRVQVDDDILDLYEGARFLNGKCSVRRVTDDEIKVTAEILCGRERIVLSKTGNVLKIGDKVYLSDDSYNFDKTKEYSVVAVNNKNKVLTYEVIVVGGSVGAKSENKTVLQVRPVKEEVLFEANYGESDQYIVKAIQEYEELADSYGSEQKIAGATPEQSQFYGELALDEAIAFASLHGKTKTAVRLIEKALSQYPNSPSARSYRIKLAGFYSTDSSSAGATVQTDDGFHTVKILGTASPLKKSTAKIAWGTQELVVTLGASTIFDLGTVTFVSVRDTENVELSYVCNSNKPTTGQNPKGETVTIGLRDTNIKTPCGTVMRVSNIDSQRYIKLRINPITKTSSVGNFTVGIGIEKRAFKLTPEKALEKIENLNKTIKTWESISENLGGVVKGLKGACFATAGVLTVKNFFTGLSGEALARKEVMQGKDGWNDKCNKEITSGESTSLMQCYNKYSDQIKLDVNAGTLAIKKSNDVTKEIETGSKYKNKEGIFTGDSFNDVEARKKLIDRINADCKDQTFGTGTEQKTIGSLFPSDAKPEQYSYSQLRDIYFKCQVIQNGGSTQGQEKARTDLLVIGNQIEQRKKYEETASKFAGHRVHVLNGGKPAGIYDGSTLENLKSRSVIKKLPMGVDDKTPAQVVISDKGQTYLVTLSNLRGGQYKTEKVYKIDDNQNVEDSHLTPAQISGTRDVPSDLNELPSIFDLTTTGSYSNSFASGETTVRYFETEPYKGMPAIVPFDLNRGFYVATTQSLPLLGQTKSFEASGRPSSFWVCNIMKDGRIGFYAPNYGDDQCVQFNVYTGQPFGSFPGLTEQETKKLTTDAIKALEQASQQYGKKNVNILGNNINLGNPASLVPGTQCQDFMSPADCKLLFNVCDPVICPATRCDFGGTYRVADVIQSGIVGSALLCLPNYKEGIVLPVCLTGIKAGIDGYLSILKSHQQCLQEAIDTGKYVGICDQINSVYLCEFFWRQAAPLASAIVPKVVEYAYNGGQGNVRGGGEYMTVASSWQNAQDSAKYFTQTYAVNSIAAFQIRSIAEAGTPFCKAFISAKGPKTFEGLIEPDSPSQFHAWFSSTDFTDATVPATAQYKVFYHIFSGNDRGVSYSVYLKDPPQTGAYSANPTVVVANGFAGRGQYATESKDFTAPKGYKTLCVRINDNEECGFKQVSSSFAVNYVRDSFVSDEITRTDITTESQCVSGSVSPLALLNPNLQSGAEEAIDPALYNRGVVRICATDNPGLSTDPTRFVNVGNCGSARLGCWLDKRSVDRAITDNNIGVRNSTLSELETFNKNSLSSKADILSSTEFRDKLKIISDKIGIGVSVTTLPGIIVELDSLNGNLQIVLFNNHRAEILYWKAKAYAKVFEGVLKGSAVKPGAQVAECKKDADCNIKYPNNPAPLICSNGYCQSLLTTPSANDGKFLTNLFFIKDESSECPRDSEKIDVDLNEGAGGAYLYLCKERSSSKESYIEKIIIGSVNERTEIESNFKGNKGNIMEYYNFKLLVSNGISDLNLGTEKHEKYVNLYAHSTANEQVALLDIEVVSNKDKTTNRCSTGFELVEGDLNEGAGGNFVYICVKKNNNLNSPFEKYLILQQSSVISSFDYDLYLGYNVVGGIKESGFYLFSKSGDKFVEERIGDLVNVVISDDPETALVFENIRFREGYAPFIETALGVGSYEILRTNSYLSEMLSGYYLP